MTAEDPCYRKCSASGIRTQSGEGAKVAPIRAAVLAVKEVYAGHISADPAFVDPSCCQHLPTEEKKKRTSRTERSDFTAPFGDTYENLGLIYHNLFSVTV